MNEEKRPRRVVTKMRYMVIVGQKFTLSSFSLALALVSGFFALCSILGVFVALLALIMTIHFPTMGAAGKSILFAFITGGVGFGVWKATNRINEKVQSIRRIVPMTRHNMDALPVQETLVRASKKPHFYQTDVLLRAAQGSQETPEEQLLHPMND